MLSLNMSLSLHLLLLLLWRAGEYFLTEQQKAAKVQAAKQEQQETRTQESKARREAAFVAPKVGWA